MIKIIDNDLFRAGEKIGWIEENRILDENGNRLGYFAANDIYDERGVRVGYLEDNRLKTMDGRSLALDDVREDISGGSYADICRAAIKLLIGD